MAFTHETLNLVLQTIGGVGPRWFFYQTDDAGEVVLGDGYFADVDSLGMKVSDLVFVVPLVTEYHPYTVVINEISDAGDATAVVVRNSGLTSVLDFQHPTDTTLTDAFERGFAVTNALWVPPSETAYDITTLEIPEGALLSAKGATFRVDGTHADETITIDVGEGAYIDELSVSSPGTDTNANLVYMRESSRIDFLKLRADTQRSTDPSGGGTGAAVSIVGDNVHLGYLDSDWFDRPLSINFDAADWVTGVSVGGGKIRRYVRGVRMDACEHFYIGTFHMSEESANGDGSPGENGIILGGGRNGFIDDQYISDSPEHGVRIASGPNGDFPGTCENIVFGNIYVTSSGRCAFKINPDEGDTVTNVTIAGVFGVDIGRDVSGGNRELLRLSKCRKVRVGVATATRQESATYSCQVGARLSNAQDVWIGSLIVEDANLGAIRGDDDGDAGPGDISNVRVGYLESTRPAVGNHISFDLSGYNIGGIYIENARFPPLNAGDGLINVAAGTTITGVIYLKAFVGGAEQPSFGFVDDTLVTVDADWGGKRELGRPSTFTWKSNFTVPGGGNLDLADAATFLSSVKLSGNEATEGVGNYSGYFDLGVPGLNRRGPGIAGKQTGNSAQRRGVARMVQNSASATNALIECTVDRHDLGLQFQELTTEPTAPAEATFYFSDGSWGAGLGFNFHDGANWRLAGERLGAATVATDADFTLTPNTSSPYQFHTGTLTADRAVTLSTSGALAGMSFRITRSGAGAFNLNVGTGPLKALATGQWAEFVYTGSAWALAQFGSL
jgi:hypothetical protein